MALPFDCSNEEHFEFDSSSILEISTSSYSAAADDDEDDDGEDAEPYTLEQGTVPVPFDSLILVNVSVLLKRWTVKVTQWLSRMF